MIEIEREREISSNFIVKYKGIQVSNNQTCCKFKKIEFYQFVNCKSTSFMIILLTGNPVESQNPIDIHRNQ